MNHSNGGAVKKTAPFLGFDGLSFTFAALQFRMKRLLRLPVFLVMLLTIGLTSHFAAIGQTHQITGKVVDLKNGKPIPFVNVWIVGSTLGTITNDNGTFIFNVSRDFFTDTHCISMLGYRSFKIQVQAAVLKGNLYIPLLPVYYSMKEVEITPDRTNAYEIIRKAIDSLQRNAPSYPYVADGFYREYISENNSYARALEAAISVYHDGKAHLGDHFFPIRINGIRTSEDYLSRFAKAGSFNQLSLFLTNNFDYKWFFSPVEETRYEIDSMVVMGKSLVYVISGTPEKTKTQTYRWTENRINFSTGTVEKVKRKATFTVKRNTDMFYRYQFYIKADDYAIVKMSYSDTLYRPLIADFARVNGLYFSINSSVKYIEFSQYNNKWFPRYLKDRKEMGFYKKKDSALFVSVAKYSDLMVNRLDTYTVRPFYPDEQPDLFEDIFAQGYKYDAEFWKSYNYLPDDELRKQVTSGLYIIKSELASNNTDSLVNPIAVKDTGNVISEKKPVHEINPDLVFKVQIMALKDQIPTTNTVFKGLKNVEVYFHKGMYKYTWGITHSLQEAMEFQKELQGAGFLGAFIVPFYKGGRINMDEAVNIYNTL